jgi:hypothetical protein
MITRHGELRGEVRRRDETRARDQSAGYEFKFNSDLDLYTGLMGHRMTQTDRATDINHKSQGERGLVGSFDKKNTTSERLPPDDLTI